MTQESYRDELIADILTNVGAIAVVGASANPARASHSVLKFLVAHGYRVVAVNPGLAGQEIAGVPVYARLADVPEPVDMVDIFRNSEAAGGAVTEALALAPLPKVIWMQLGVTNEAAAAAAEAKGLTVIMNRCPKIEFHRLSDQIHGRRHVGG